MVRGLLRSTAGSIRQNTVPFEDWSSAQNFQISNFCEDSRALSSPTLIGTRMIRKILKELESLSNFQFKFRNKEALVQIDHSQQFQLSVSSRKKTMSDLKAVIQFIESVK